MIIFVVILNLIIATFNFYLAIKLWQLRKLFALIASALISCDNYLKYVLILSPQILLKEQISIYQFRKQYQLWQLQLQRVRQLIIILSWMYRTWRKTKLTRTNY